MQDIKLVFRHINSAHHQTEIKTISSQHSHNLYLRTDITEFKSQYYLESNFREKKTQLSSNIKHKIFPKKLRVFRNTIVFIIKHQVSRHDFNLEQKQSLEI